MSEDLKHYLKVFGLGVLSVLVTVAIVYGLFELLGQMKGSPW